MDKVAVTGGLSSGKSTVCKIFKHLGAYTVSSDDIVHHLLKTDPVLQKKIVDLLGKDVLIQNQIDREKVASNVFSNPEKLKALEAIIHPAVLHEIKKHIDIAAKDGNYPLFVAEVPLLYEVGAEALFDSVITVLCSEQICKERFSRLNPSIQEQFHDRMMRQLPPEAKAAKADYILLNNGDLQELQSQVEHLIKKICTT